MFSGELNEFEKDWRKDSDAMIVQSFTMRGTVLTRFAKDDGKIMKAVGRPWDPSQRGIGNEETDKSKRIWSCEKMCCPYDLGLSPKVPHP